MPEGPKVRVLAFGSERRGLSDELTERAQLRISMREGVSSLSLATSMAAVLFSWRRWRRARDVSG